MSARAQSTGLCAVAGCERWTAPGSKYCEPHGAERRAAASTATDEDGFATFLDLFGTPPEPEPERVIPVKAHERHIKPRVTPHVPAVGDTVRIVKSDGTVTDATMAYVSPGYAADVARARARLPDAYDDQAPYAPNSPTSRAAAASVEGEHVRTQMQRVYDYIVSRGEYGATRQEIADALGLLWQSCGARVRRLVQKGVIGSNGDTRKSRASDRDAEVLLAERYVTRWQADQQRPGDYHGVTDDGEAPR